MKVTDTQVLENAAFAAARIKKGSHLLDWFSIGAGFDVGVRYALAETGANDRESKQYRNAFGKWMKDQEWTADFDKATRSHAIWLHENRVAIDEFLATLDTNKRLKMNHPTVVRRAWDRAHMPAKEPGEEKPKQVKIDVDELEALHADLEAATKEIDLLRENSPEDPSGEDRIEVLERELDEAHKEIARLQSQLEKANTKIEGFKTRIGNLPELVAQLDESEFQRLKANKGKARKRPQKGKDKPTEAVSSDPPTNEAAFNK